MKKVFTIVALVVLVACLSTLAACGINANRDFYEMLIPEEALANATEVSEEIDAIGEVAWDSGYVIASARARYDALTDLEKNLVYNIGVLQKAENDFAMLGVCAESLSDKIAKFGDASKGNEAEIEGAYIEYWSLDEAERAKVVGYDKLCSLREQVTELYAKERRADSRMSRAKIQIGTYCYRGTTEEDVQELAECGIDFVAADVASDEMLEWYEKYNIGAFLSAWHVGLPTYNGGWRKDTDSNQPFPINHLLGLQTKRLGKPSKP